MRTLVLSILWLFASNSCTAAEIPVESQFYARGLDFLWYTVAAVMDHGSLDHLLTFGKIIRIITKSDMYSEPMAKLNMYTDFYYVRDGRCYVETVLFWHTERRGQFKTHSSYPQHDGYNVHIVDTDYYLYNIFHMERDGKKALFLDARKPKVSARVIQKFEEWALSLGFSVDKIIYQSQKGDCFKIPVVG